MGAIDNIEKIRTLLKDFTGDKGAMNKHVENKNNVEVALTQERILLYYKGKMEVLASDVLEFCKDLIEGNEDMKMKEYYDGFGNSSGANGKWQRVSQMLAEHFEEVKGIEQTERKGKCKYYFEEGIDIFGQPKETLKWKRVGKDGETEGSVEDIFTENKVLYDYVLLRDTFEYRLCRRLGDYILDKENDVTKVTESLLKKLAQTVCFFIALKNEQTQLIRRAKIFGIPLAGGGQQTTINAPKKGTNIPHELDTPKGRTLLRKVVKAGYCDKDYNWDDTKWKPGKSRLALACFAYRASEYLNLSTKTNKDGGPTTSWQPFETLFTYQGKEKGKNKLKQRTTDYMRTQNSFNPEEMDEIDKLFR